MIELSQRDINIAFMNELSRIFHRLGIGTNDVLAAASTKWNFLAFTPGLVGGHCIGVGLLPDLSRSDASATIRGDPGRRRINDSVSEHIARECVRLMTNQDRATNRRVAVLNPSPSKENIPDLHQFKIADHQRVGNLRNRVVVRRSLARRGGEEGIRRDPHGQGDQPGRRSGLRGAMRDYVEAGWPLISRSSAAPAASILDVKKRARPFDQAERHHALAPWGHHAGALRACEHPALLGLRLRARPSSGGGGVEISRRGSSFHFQE